MRIAIVNDLMMAVEAMRRVVLAGKRDEIAWIARDGVEAVARCAEDTPDLILMDLIMPRMDGVEATRRIMAHTPCAIVVVTANVDNNYSKVFDAMGAGALDAVNTPLQAPGTEGAAALLAKIDTIRKLIGNSGAKRFFSPKPEVVVPLHPQGQLVLIGASAGGPAALARILADLPASFPGAVVIVQHVDAQFMRGLAGWLDQQSQLPVRLAEEGDVPRPGTVLMAGESRHLVFAAPMRLGYQAEPVDTFFHPSIDVLFKSADRFWEGDITAVLLTGMGRDGAEGLLALRRNGHHTITQDAASSAVYGMPKAAADLRAATEILALERIGPRLATLIKPPLKAYG